MANGVLEEAKKEKKECFIFKVSYEKSYDLVSWSLYYMIRRLDF